MYKKQFEIIVKAAKAAGEVVIKYYNDKYAVEIKEDDSPVTSADLASDKIIQQILHKAYPHYPILSEETTDSESRLSSEYVFIVDPLDGTKEFIDRTGEFAINIALVVNGEVVVGVIYAPIRDELYYALKGEGAYVIKAGEKSKLQVSDKTTDLIALVSRNHLRQEEVDFLKANEAKIKQTAVIGASLKGCLIAQGEADIFYRYGPGTKEWDTAPQDLIVSEAGGLFLTPTGEKFTYNKKDVVNRSGYIIVNRKENIWL